MTREEAIKKHRKMWNWLAENPEETKSCYLKKFDYKNTGICHDCYLCDYADAVYVEKDICGHADAIYIDGNRCAYCPLAWPGSCCESEDGLFIQWCESQECWDYERAAEIARRIAELPEKEE